MRLATSTAQAEVHRARRLRSMPATAAALAHGRISVDHADALIRVNQPGVTDTFARDETILVGQAQDLLFPDFCRALRYWSHHADALRAEHHADRQHATRHVEVVRTLDDTVDLRGLLDPVDGGIFLNEFQRLEQRLFEADWAAARAKHGEAATPEHLARTPGQRRADALVDMARRSSTTPDIAEPARPLITVLVGYETLAGPICELSDGTVITPGQVLPLLDQADIERVVFDSPKRVLEVGRRRRFFDGALRRAIEVRDRHCTHPGCSVPAERCQVDHIHEWAHGGMTTQDNGRLLCPVHNRGRPGRPPP